jgi:mycothiol synthase
MLDLRAGGAEGFTGVRVSDGSGTIAYAQISRGNETSSLEVAIRGGLADAGDVLGDVAETAVDTFRRRGGGTLFWWLDDPGPHETTLVTELGFEPARTLYEMRRPLPMDRRSAIDTRPFVVGTDEEAWLRVNNRAFAAHGEQGGWTPEALSLRTSEPWFDPDGFRLHEIEGRLAGFCWTKLHHTDQEVVGEIYVIAVDPDFHGRGLGTELTLAGLDSITDRGVPVADLYVDADNVAAVRLYERLGFGVHRRRQAFAATFGAPGA